MHGAQLICVCIWKNCPLCAICCFAWHHCHFALSRHTFSCQVQGPPIRLPKARSNAWLLWQFLASAMPRFHLPAHATVQRVARHWHGQSIHLSPGQLRCSNIVPLQVVAVFVVSFSAWPGNSTPWASSAGHGRRNSKICVTTGPSSWPMP